MGEHDGFTGLEARLVERVEEARLFLGRWTDPWTRNAADELAHDAVAEAWICRARIRERGRVGGFVRTIARRMRGREIDRTSRLGAARRPLSLERDEPRTAARPLVPGAPTTVTFAGHTLVCRATAEWLWSLLGQRGDLSGLLLMRFCEGFSVSELADRYALSEVRVKMRLHRTRGWLRRRALDELRTGAASDRQLVVDG